MTRLMRTVRPGGERFKLYTQDGLVEVYIRLETTQEVRIAEKAGRLVGTAPRPFVSFDMPASVHLERE